MKKTIAFLLFCLCIQVSAPAQWDKDVFLIRGRQALSDGKYGLAIENFNILARLDTSDYWNFFFRGIAKYNLGDLRGARRDFDRSVRINPVFTNGYHYRAITESRNGDYSEALKDLETAIKLRPGFNGLYYSRGVTYFLAQQFGDALKDFDRYIRKEPSDPSAYLNRGATQLFLGDTLKAVSDYNKAIKLDRFEPESYIRRGQVLAAQGKPEQAITDMNQAIELDSTSTFAYFNRALLLYDMKDYNGAMKDLNRVLKDEPGNALTLYNRSLILAQVGDFKGALDDMDRVLNINPDNVLAHFNRASVFVEMGRWKDALKDYDKAIELYPDFAKAYMNRSYAKLRLGDSKGSKEDYDTARKKVREFSSKSGSGDGQSWADTTRKYSGLLSFDADFAKKGFDDELLQHRDIDVKLRPLFRFKIGDASSERVAALSTRYENALLDHFLESFPEPIRFTNEPGSESCASTGTIPEDAEQWFLRGLKYLETKQYNDALNSFDRAVSLADTQTSKEKYERWYKAFYLLNRGVLKAEMIDFIASLEGNVQTLSMDDQGTARTRVGDKIGRTYDYSEAIGDIRAAIAILPEIPQFHFNLGNLRCLSSDFVSAINSYNEAIGRYPAMGDAYFNRGLVLIYLKDKEKGCIDLSRAGELGIKDAYSVISKYCKEEKK